MPGITAARKFQCIEFIGACIGAALVYPAMVNIAATLMVYKDEEAAKVLS